MSREAAVARGITADIRGGVGEAMPFESARFDTVVTTFTLCSVADQAAVLAEIRRVLKPGRSEEHTSELQSLMRISYAVFCLKKKINTQNRTTKNNITFYQTTKEQTV